MSNYLLKRIGQALATVFLVVTTVFVLIRLAPGDPAAALAGPNATSEQLAQVRHELDLDQPIPVQYLHFLGNLLHGNLGFSTSYNESASRVVFDHLPYTFTLAAAAIILTALIAIPLGMLAARRANSWLDTSTNVLTIAGQSMPDFWLGVVLIVLFAITWPIFPTSGFQTWGALVLPALTIAMLQTAVISRVVRGEMVRGLSSQYVATARARGVSESRLTFRYALSNASIPVLTVLGTRFASMLNGIVVVEVVFSWPGIGSLIVRALETRDYSLIQAVVIVTALLSTGVQLLVDLAYPALDPRVRLGKAVTA